jgi:hypothetical protein
MFILKQELKIKCSAIQMDFVLLGVFLHFLGHPVLSMPVNHKTLNYCCPPIIVPHALHETHFTYTLSLFYKMVFPLALISISFINELQVNSHITV